MSTSKPFLPPSPSPLSAQKRVTILGIDPGTNTTGYGVIQTDGSQITALDFGAIRPSKKSAFSDKLLAIFDSVESLINRFQPDILSIELQFVSKNAQSAMKLGMARGAALLAAARNGVEVFEYAPRKAKQAVVGNGAAGKEQVQKMVQLILHLPVKPEPEDAADALALAICHAHTLKKRSYV